MKLMSKNFLVLLFISITVINYINGDEEEVTVGVDEEETDYNATSNDTVNDDDDVIAFTQLCKFDLPMLNHSTVDDEDFCNCDVIPSASTGQPSVKIDCELSDHVTNLTNKIFRAQKLPVNTLSLILSYQHFSEVPDFVGDHLQHLEMSNNFITIVKNSNFIHVTSLEHLDLSYNRISEIEPRAFEQLLSLRHLDLTSNHLVAMPADLLKPLVILETLKLSNNEGFKGNLPFLHFGITPRLKELQMTHCNLSTTLNLRLGDDLRYVNLAFNNFSDFASIELPDHVEILDLGGNPIYNFTAKSLPNLAKLTELYLRDLPVLESVDEYSLYGFPQLRLLTFEASRSLSEIHPHSFGINAVEDENSDVNLKVVSFRGCNLISLDEALRPIFNQLDEFHLEGNPLNCNCNMKWIKQLEIETNARCHKPEVFRDKLLSSEVPEKKMKCENLFLRKFVNTMILMLLLVSISLAIWFFLSRLNPSRRHKLQKVGPESPYKRVTIEPNRAEYSLY